MTVAVPITGPVPVPAQVEDFDAFPPDVLERTAFWLREFSLAWHSEAPIKIHTGLRDVDGGGGPAFHPDFINYIDRPCKRRTTCFDLHCNHDQDDPAWDPRRRTTRAFRKLKETAPREFDALYLVCRHGLSISEVAAQLTARAIRIDKPERYGNAAVLMLVISGIDKVVRWW